MVEHVLKKLKALQNCNNENCDDCILQCQEEDDLEPWCNYRNAIESAIYLLENSDVDVYSKIRKEQLEVNHDSKRANRTT